MVFPALEGEEEGSMVFSGFSAGGEDDMVKSASQIQDPKKSKRLKLGRQKNRSFDAASRRGRR